MPTTSAYGSSAQASRVLTRCSAVLASGMTGRPSTNSNRTRRRASPRTAAPQGNPPAELSHLARTQHGRSIVSYYVPHRRCRYASTRSGAPPLLVRPSPAFGPGWARHGPNEPETAANSAQLTLVSVPADISFLQDFRRVRATSDRRLKIVVSPVRVRVSPSELPASRCFLLLKGLSKRPGRGRISVRVPNRVPKPGPGRSSGKQVAFGAVTAQSQARYPVPLRVAPC